MARFHKRSSTSTSIYEAFHCNDGYSKWLFIYSLLNNKRRLWLVLMCTLFISNLLVTGPNLTNINISNSIIALANQGKDRIHDGGGIVTFHLAFTLPKFTKLNQRCIESIFYFHPKARVILHSNAEHGIHTADPQLLEPIQRLIERGYHIEIIPFHAADLLQSAMDLPDSIINKVLAKEWMPLISTQYKFEIYWYSNETNLLRMSILYASGGIYLDTDVVLVRPLVALEPSNQDDKNSNIDPSIMRNTITDYNGLNTDNVMSRDTRNNDFECAVMKFLHPGNIFLGHAINNFMQHYNGTFWGNNGPAVFGRVSEAMPSLLCPEPYDFAASSSRKLIKDEVNSPLCHVQPLPGAAFQPVESWDWRVKCYNHEKSPVGIEAMNLIRRPNVYAVHMNNKIYGDLIADKEFVPGSVCDISLQNFCILCE